MFRCLPRATYVFSYVIYRSELFQEKKSVTIHFRRLCRSISPRLISCMTIVLVVGDSAWSVRQALIGTFFGQVLKIEFPGTTPPRNRPSVLVVHFERDTERYRNDASDESLRLSCNNSKRSPAPNTYVTPNSYRCVTRVGSTIIHSPAPATFLLFV